MVRVSVAPITLAASTYCCSLVDSTTPRTIRCTCGMPTNPKAKATTNKLGCDVKGVIDRMRISGSNGGEACKTSGRRCTAVSNHPRKKTLNTPITEPMAENTGRDPKPRKPHTRASQEQKPHVHLPG